MIYEVCGEWKEGTHGLAFGVHAVSAEDKQTAVIKAVQAAITEGSIDDVDIDRINIYARPFG